MPLVYPRIKPHAQLHMVPIFTVLNHPTSVIFGLFLVVVHPSLETLVKLDLPGARTTLSICCVEQAMLLLSTG